MTVMKIIVMMPVQLLEEEENLKHFQNMKKKIKVLFLQRPNFQNVHHLRNIMTVMKIIVMMPVQLEEEEEVVEDKNVEDEAEPEEEEKNKNGLKLKRKKKKDYSWLANIMKYSVKREKKDDKNKENLERINEQYMDKQIKDLVEEGESSIEISGVSAQSFIAGDKKRG